MPFVSFNDSFTRQSKLKSKTLTINLATVFYPVEAGKQATG